MVQSFAFASGGEAIRSLTARGQKEVQDLWLGSSAEAKL
eukprot:SAG22_NODE_2360_length_2666_cov_1.181924_3_plen_39_part_00